MGSFQPPGPHCGSFPAHREAAGPAGAEQEVQHRIRIYLGPWGLSVAHAGSLEQQSQPVCVTSAPCHPWRPPAGGHLDHLLSSLQPWLSLILPQPHSPPHLHLCRSSSSEAQPPGAPSPKAFPELPIGLLRFPGKPVASCASLPALLHTALCLCAKRGLLSVLRTLPASSATCSASTD